MLAGLAGLAEVRINHATDPTPVSEDDHGISVSLSATDQHST